MSNAFYQSPFAPPPNFDDDIPMSDNSRTVLEKRFVRKHPDGTPAETVNEMFWRVASFVAQGEVKHGESHEHAMQQAHRFYDMLAEMRFLPNSPTFTGAGTKLGNLSACFVLPVADDMGGHPDGIFQTLRNATLIQQAGGGNGFSFSRLRPKGARVRSSNGFATGPVGFMKAYDQAFGIVNQGGVRRGANMGILRVDHPDIREFIQCKQSEDAITNFNISVALTDKFMQAVKDDSDFDLINPDDGTVWETLRARDLFNMIVQFAHNNGEPGAVFIDAANRDNPVPHLGTYEATNPCVTGDTLIYTDKGLITARELWNDETAINVLVDGRFGASTNLMPASTVFMTGVKPVFKLTTKEGYSVRATADHRIMTPRGWIELQNLRAGDKIHIANQKGGFGNEGSLKLGRTLGWLVADDTITRKSAVLSFFGDDKGELAPMFAGYVDALVAPLTSETARRSYYPVGVVNINGRDELRVQSNRLRLIADEHGIADDKHVIPDAVWRGTEDMQRGYLQSLFTADGTVSTGEKGASVRLTQSNLAFLLDTQKLLLNFGIASKIYVNRRGEGFRELPNGKGGTQAYWCQASHELAISKRNLETFAEEIGFLLDYKQDTLTDYINSRTRGTYSETFTATVVSIEPDGIEEVFDLTQPDTSSFIANGIVVHNCAEQWLLPYESCNLGAINIAAHVVDGNIDWQKLKATVITAYEFLDDVVTMNGFVDAVPQLREAADKTRRIGLGIMGLADAMMLCGVRYGSDKGQYFAAHVMAFIRYEAMLQSINRAKTYGPFPAIKGSIYDRNNLQWKALEDVYDDIYHNDDNLTYGDWKYIQSLIRKHGIRNATQVTVAPTGTRATVAGLEGYGCEPVFALAYTRYVVDTDTPDHDKIALTYTSPLFERVLRQHGCTDSEIKRYSELVADAGTCQGIDEIPESVRNVCVVSADITPEEHVAMQAAIQPFVDSGISKTINMPATATLDDVKTAYMMAWETGCKGITVYVTGSRSEVVLETKATATGNASTPERRERPASLTGVTTRTVTPLGTAYVTVNESRGEPFEVFVNTAKAGTETSAVSEALGRLLSLLLRVESPVASTLRLEEAVKQLRGIGGGRSIGLGSNRVVSLPDAVARALADYLGQTDAPVITDGEAEHGDLCPDCGDATLLLHEGCVSCHECGYAEC